MVLALASYRVPSVGQGHDDTRRPLLALTDTEMIFG